MADRFILAGSLGGEGPLPKEPYRSERQALIRAGELFDKYGSRVMLEILLNDMEPALRDINWMKRWNVERRRLPPEELNQDEKKAAAPLTKIISTITETKGQSKVAKLTEHERLLRDINGLKESVRLGWIDMASRPMTGQERRELRKSIDSLVQDLNDLRAKLDSNRVSPKSNRARSTLKRGTQPKAKR